MASKGALVVRFIGDTKDFDRATRSVQNSTSKFGALGRVGRAAGVALAAGAAIAGAAAIKVGADSVRAASDMSESLSKANVVFGKNAKQVIAWSKTSATAFGMSQQAALEASGTIGNLLLSMGKTPKQASQMSTGIVKLAADLGSFNNVPVEEVLTAIRSGLTGEIAPLRRFGVNLTDATMKAKALEMGLYSGKGALDVTAKSSAAYALILEQTKTAQGDFARTSDGLANQQKILRAQFDNMKVSIGQKLLPVVVKLMGWMTSTGVPALAKVGAVIEQDVVPAFRAVSDFVQSTVLPAFARIGEGSGRTSAALAQFKANFSSIFASVSSILQSVGGFLQAFWGRYGDLITRFGIGTLRNFIQQLRGFANIITGIFKLIAAVLKGDWSGAWAAIKQIARGAVQVVGAMISQFWNVIKTLFRAGGRAIVDLMRGVWGGIKGLVRSGADTIMETVRGIPGRLKGLAKSFRNAGVTLIQNFVNGLSNAGQFVSNIVGSVLHAVKGAINAALGKIESAISFKIDWPGPGSYSFTPSIPRLATGTQNWRGGWAEVGEHGRELVKLPGGSKVFPAGQSAQMMSGSGGGGSGGGGMTVSITINGALDPIAVGKQVEEALNKVKRSRGGRALAFQ